MSIAPQQPREQGRKLISPLRGSLQTRRDFLRHAGTLAAALAVPSFVPASARGADGWRAPSERINVALIGHGQMGSGHLRVLLGRKDTQVIAVCDVDRIRREKARQLADNAYADAHDADSYRGCAAINDFRELLARPDLDAVLIVTPDHWHTLLAIEAARAGKDVYCEKPVSLTLREGRLLVEGVRRYSCVFQTGTQYRSIPTIRQVCGFVRGGGLGQVKSVFTKWRKGLPHIDPSSYVPLDPLLPTEPVPEGLDWNLWVGPAAYHHYNPAYHRNPMPGVVPWTFCESFGAGAITNYHSHAADVIQYAIGMETSGPVEIIHPSTGEFPTLTCRYANGILLHHVENWEHIKTLYHAVPGDARLAGNFGGVFVGERGWVTSMSTGGPIEASTPELLAAMNLRTREVSTGSNNHHANWLESIRARARPSCDEEIGHRSASLGHLVALSYRLGDSLQWDPAKEEFRGNDAANRMRSRAMREPWTI